VKPAAACLMHIFLTVILVQGLWAFSLAEDGMGRLFLGGGIIYLLVVWRRFIIFQKTAQDAEAKEP
jgi:hypothetical protein